MMKSFVIIISGISGSGKTTVINALKERILNSAVISFDDYPGDLLGYDYCEWSESGANCNDWHLEPIISDVLQLKNQSFDYIMIDYLFGKAYQAMKPYVDFAVWIDTPLDISLARRLIRDFLRRSPTRRPIGNAADETLSYLEFYLNRHRATYLRHIETIRLSADLVVDGMKSPEVIADEILTHINTRIHYDALINENNDLVHDPVPLKEIE